MLKDQWKKEKINQTFGAFFDQFGDLDEYSRMVLEIIFEEIYGGKKEAIPLFGEKRQEGDEIGMRIPGSQGFSTN